ncbi:hypothetical protein ACFE04_006732 [Oxalis oulophora]
MNSSSSSSSSSHDKHKYNKYAQAPTTINLKTQQQQHKLKKKTPQTTTTRNPLKDLNLINGDQSSNLSIEPPKGCLRFLLSHSHSSSSSFSSSCSSKTPFSNSIKPIKSLSKTPKSATNALKPTSQLHTFKINTRAGQNPNLETGAKWKKYSTLNSSGKFVNSLTSGCRGNDDANFTPVTKLHINNGISKVGVDEDRANSASSDTKTPPLQASLSPEIQNQSESSLLSTNTAITTTPACYAAGHVMSGVSDKRKCRPRGLLIVGEDGHLQGNLCKADSFNVSDYDGDGNKSSVGLLPLPVEASMHWLLSPCDEEEDEKLKENSKNRFRRLEECDTHNSPLLSSGHGFSSDFCDNSDNKNSGSICNRRRTRSRSSPLAPPDFTESREILGFPDENSPFSVDLLDSGNVMLTPQSDSSFDRRVHLVSEDHKQYPIDSQASLVAEDFPSSKSHVSLWDPIDSSFQFDCLNTSSNLIDISHFQKYLNDRTSWFSNSTTENISQSDLRISWREGLTSRIFDMGEEDSCRCLTDEEENVNDGCKGEPKSNQNLELNIDAETNQDFTKGLGITEFANNKPKVNGKNERFLAESISTDGGGLNASGDSDWSLCYNNGLFKV